MLIDVRTIDCEAILDLRHRVLRAGRPRESARLPGDDLATTVHFAALDGGQIIGCATFLESSLDGRPAWQLRGMASAPDRAGQGVGRNLLDRAMSDLSARAGVRLFWCNARVSALGFYEKMGWTAFGPQFEIEGVGPHFKMRREI